VNKRVNNYISSPFINYLGMFVMKKVALFINEIDIVYLYIN